MLSISIDDEFQQNGQPKVFRSDQKYGFVLKRYHQLENHQKTSLTLHKKSVSKKITIKNVTLNFIFPDLKSYLMKFSFQHEVAFILEISPQFVPIHSYILLFTSQLLNLIISNNKFRTGIYIMIRKAFNSYSFSQFIKLSKYTEKYQNVAKLQLDNPKKKNALSVDLLAQLDDAVKSINHDHSLRAVVLKSSQEGHFCAGADLKERLNKTPEDIELIVANLRRVFNDIRNIHCPVFCLIDGPALGGGLQLALNADIRIATKKALLGLPQTHWSLIPGAGGTQTLARIIGVARAKQLIFTARKISAQQGLSYGMVNYVQQNHTEAQKRAFSIIDQLLPNAPLAIKHAKKAVNWGSEVDLRTALQIQRFNYERIVYTNDRKQGFKAFAERREPQYKGE